MNDIFSQLDEKINAGAQAVAPNVASFREFLVNHARVKITSGPEAGRYTNYTFVGREALIEPCDVIDKIIGDGTSQPLKDSTLVLAGGAQFGKTVMELNLAAYLAGVRFISPGVYMPDDQLAADIVDAKFRPEVMDQIPWFADRCKLGKSVNKSGKAVDTKGAFLVTDGERKAVGMFRGLRKVPTSFSLDVVVRDEEDDIPRANAKFLSGRLTASQLRLQIIVGTQRIHGAGQNKQWEDGSQGVMMIQPFDTIVHPEKFALNPEEAWPQVCRLQMGSRPSRTDPRLTWEGDFRHANKPDETVASYTPDGIYYLAHPQTGDVLNRNNPIWLHRRPERIAQRRWSYRIAQIGCAAIDLGQIVAHWTRAVQDDEEMTSFCCDRLARPKSAAQSITPAILDRARKVAPFDFGVIDRDKVRVAGLDTGNRCWLFTRELLGDGSKRCVRVDKIAIGDMVPRMQVLWESLGLSALFIDENPAVDQARTLALHFNGLMTLTDWPKVDWNSKDTYLSLPGGLTWDGRNQQWRNLRCAVVRFSKKQLGMGVEHSAVEFDADGQKKFVPLISCNRYETIDRAVKELLTPAENVMEVITVAGKRMVRQTPAMLLPRQIAGASGMLETLDAHLLAGSQRVKDDKSGELGDYIDKTENHLLLADGYSALAETCAVGVPAVSFAAKSVVISRPGMDSLKGGFAL